MPQVFIDSARCQGHGRCAELAPGYFDIDDDGVGLVTCEEVAAADIDAVAAAVRACPENAVTLRD